MKHKKRMLIKNRKELNRAYKKNNKVSIIVLDVLVILAVLFNIGAMVITNAMVVKEEPQIEFREVNPVQAQLNDYEVHSDWKDILFPFVKQCLMWVLFIGYYLHRRRNILDDVDYSEMHFIVIMWVILLGLDFFNDFGYALGKLIWGG